MSIGSASGRADVLRRVRPGRQDAHRVAGPLGRVVATGEDGHLGAGHAVTWTATPPRSGRISGASRVSSSSVPNPARSPARIASSTNRGARQQDPAVDDVVGQPRLRLRRQSAGEHGPAPGQRDGRAQQRVLGGGQSPVRGRHPRAPSERASSGGARRRRCGRLDPGPARVDGGPADRRTGDMEPREPSTTARASRPARTSGIHSWSPSTHPCPIAVSTASGPISTNRVTPSASSQAIPSANRTALADVPHPVVRRGHLGQLTRDDRNAGLAGTSAPRPPGGTPPASGPSAGSGTRGRPSAAWSCAPSRRTGRLRPRRRRLQARR